MLLKMFVLFEIYEVKDRLFSFPKIPYNVKYNQNFIMCKEILLCLTLNHFCSVIDFKILMV